MHFPSKPVPGSCIAAAEVLGGGCLRLGRVSFILVRVFEVVVIVQRRWLEVALLFL